MNTINLSTLKIHSLSNEQYQRELEKGTIDENSLYLTPNDDVYYTETEIDSKIAELNTSIAGKSDSNHNHDDKYATKTELNSAANQASTYINSELAKKASTSSVNTSISDHNASTSAHSDIRNLISGLTTRLNSLADSDDTTLDQLSEIVTYIKSNRSLIDSVTTSKLNVSDIIDNLATAVSNKALSANQGVEIKKLVDALQASLDSHKHEISGVTGLQVALDGKAEVSHGTHVSYSASAPVMDGTASAGTAVTVARSDHKHPTDTSRASKSELDTHTSDVIKHISASERTNWNSAKNHADSAHAPSNAEKNQNAFSNIVVGSTIVAADNATDTLTLDGSNVTITPDATNDKVTIGITKANITSALGYTPPTTNTTYSAATIVEEGLMSAADKKKLDEIDSIYASKNELNSKQNTITGAATTVVSSNLTKNKVVVSNENGKLISSEISKSELDSLSGISSNIQTQIDSKFNASDIIISTSTSSLPNVKNGAILIAYDL